MKNDSTAAESKISIPPTVLFSAVSKMADVSNAVTMNVKTGDLVLPWLTRLNSGLRRLPLAGPGTGRCFPIRRRCP